MCNYFVHNIGPLAILICNYFVHYIIVLAILICNYCVHYLVALAILICKYFFHYRIASAILICNSFAHYIIVLAILICNSFVHSIVAVAILICNYFVHYIVALAMLTLFLFPNLVQQEFELHSPAQWKIPKPTTTLQTSRRQWHLWLCYVSPESHDHRLRTHSPRPVSIPSCSQQWPRLEARHVCQPPTALQRQHF